MSQPSTGSGELYLDARDDEHSGVGLHKVLNKLRDEYHSRSVDAGWWDELDEILLYLPDRFHKSIETWYLATKICLIHSEVSEMMEGLRKGAQDDHLPLRTMEEVEGADILIRYFDYAGRRQHDISGAVHEKGEYNKDRPDHKIDSRSEVGGKKF